MPPVAAPDSYAFRAGRPIYAGLTDPNPGIDITTLTFVNDSAAEQPAGVVSRSFGLPIKRGDMPAGEYPVFEQGGVVCPATLWGVTTWPDGSMKFCAGMLRFAAAVAGSGSASVVVKSGGALPAASNRALSDLAAADLSVALTGVTNLTGEWVASLADAIAAGSDVVQIGDGPAGAVWRMGGDFKQGGAAHGQLYCWHYVSALQNSGGGLAGVRYLGRFGQVFTEVNSPTKTYRDCTAQLKSGASAVRQIQGVTTRSGNAPGPVSSTFRIPHWTTCTTSGADAHWDFVQGGGSAAAECTVRCIQDAVYLQQSMVIPPYDLTIPVGNTANADYYINARANYTNYLLGSTGDYEYIGLLPAWAVRYFINPTAQNEKQVRVNAMAAFGFAIELRKSSTRQLVANKGAASYAGFGVTETTYYFDGGNYIGITPPTDNQALWQTEAAHRPAPAFPAYVMTGEPQYLDHMLATAMSHALTVGGGYRNLKSARPISSPILDQISGNGGIRIDSALPEYVGAGVLFKAGGIRQGAWALRDITHALALCPDTPPDGCDYKGYLGLHVNNSVDCFNDYMATQPAQWQADGMFTLVVKNIGNGESMWQTSYLGYAACHASVIYPQANLTQFRQYLARRYNAQLAVGNMSMLAANGTIAWTNTGLAESMAELRHSMAGSAAPLTFSVASNNVTLGAIPAGYSDWSYMDGDALMFYVSDISGNIPPGSEPYAEIESFKSIYVVNAVGKSFQLSLTPGGAPLTVIRDFVMGSGTTYHALVQNSVVGFSTGVSGGAGGTLPGLVGVANYHEALGDNVAAAAAVLRSHDAFFNYDYSVTPKWRVTPSIPATGAH